MTRYKLIAGKLATHPLADIARRSGSSGLASSTHQLCEQLGITSGDRARTGRPKLARPGRGAKRTQMWADNASFSAPRLSFDQPSGQAAAHQRMTLAAIADFIAGALRTLLFSKRIKLPLELRRVDQRSSPGFSMSLAIANTFAMRNRNAFQNLGLPRTGRSLAQAIHEDAACTPAIRPCRLLTGTVHGTPITHLAYCDEQAAPASVETIKTLAMDGFPVLDDPNVLPRPRFGSGFFKFVMPTYRSPGALFAHKARVSLMFSFPDGQFMP